MNAAEGTDRLAVGGFIATVNQYWVAYHVTIAFAFLLVWEVLFLPETQYPRAEVVAHELRRAVAEAHGESVEDVNLTMKRTTQLPWLVRQPSLCVDADLLMLLTELPKDPRCTPPQTVGNADNVLQIMGIPKTCCQRVRIHISSLLVVRGSLPFRYE